MLGLGRDLLYLRENKFEWKVKLNQCLYLYMHNFEKVCCVFFFFLYLLVKVL